DAANKYWTVARFGQVMDSDAHDDYQRWTGSRLQALAYKRLHALDERQGNAREAALFGYLAEKFNPTSRAREGVEQGVFGWYIARRNAAFLQISSLLMIIFVGLLIFASCWMIAGKLRSGPQRRSRPGLTMLAFAGALGFLLSSATLYLTYRPYWYMFQDAMLKGRQTSQSADLRRFLMATHGLPVIGLHNGGALFLPVYFWTAVILAGVALIAFIFLRHLRDPAQLGPAQPDSHMQ
ncbi:MAG: hypothetical protein KGM47_00075, partial [Acidobacteriota bacterium]|nr:hypothetical protein [Acidobacteriota bacterium]